MNSLVAHPKTMFVDQQCPGDAREATASGGRGLCFAHLSDPHLTTLEGVRWRQFFYLPEYRIRPRYVLIGQVVVQGFAVYIAADCRVLQKSLDLGSEHKPTAGLCIDQRLLAHAVAGTEKLLRALIP